MPGDTDKQFHFLRQDFECHWDTSKRHRFVYTISYVMEREKKDDFLLLRFIICYSRIYILYFSFFVSLLLEEYGVIEFELNCSNGMYMELMEDTFGITSNGNLKLDRETWLTQDTYCVDMLFDKQDNCKEDLYALICFPERIENNIR